MGILSTLVMPSTKPSALYYCKSTNINSSLSSLTLATLACQSWCCWDHRLLLYFWNVRLYGSWLCHLLDNRLFWKWTSLSKLSNCCPMRHLICGLPWCLLLTLISFSQRRDFNFCYHPFLSSCGRHKPIWNASHLGTALYFWILISHQWQCRLLALWT